MPASTRDDPTASRFIDEDINRVWDEETLDGGRRSLRTAPGAGCCGRCFDTVDVLLDLHSMLWPSDPLMLVRQSARAARAGAAGRRAAAGGGG